jgi:hypothetical protein
MKSPLSYLIAARQCEIDELERLGSTSELVRVVGRYIHAAQRERGITNIFLASQGQDFRDMRVMQVAECESQVADVAAAFERLGHAGHPVGNGARLFNRIAMALHALEGLPELRARIALRALTPREANDSYVRLIAAFLSVVFEAADSAGDPDISRALVALFNFMQGKELAGQERALGAAAFASGPVDAPTQCKWRHLIEQQQQCFDVFMNFADPQVLAAEQASHDHRALAQLERLRRMGLLGGAPVRTGAPAQWYDCCTLRIDAMHAIEDVIAERLRTLCERKVAQARSALRDQHAGMESLQRDAAAASSDAPRRFGLQLEQSVYDMVQEQSRRLQAMSEELDTARSALNERKVIERAKGLLMAHRRFTEEEAYKTLRQMAMNQKRRIGEVAEALLAMAEVLPGAE